MIYFSLSDNSQPGREATSATKLGVGFSIVSAQHVIPCTWPRRRANSHVTDHAVPAITWRVTCSGGDRPKSSNQVMPMAGVV